MTAEVPVIRRETSRPPLPTTASPPLTSSLPSVSPDEPGSSFASGRCSPTVAWLALLCLLLAFYLSVSVPLAVYSRRLGFGQGVVQVVFRPVGWLHDHTPLRYPLRWWARMWDPAIE